MNMRLQTRTGQTLNVMIPAGEFLPRRQSPAGKAGLAARIGIGATLIALMAGSAAAAALLLWLVSVLLPVALLAAFVAYTAFRIQFGAAGRQAALAREI
jgi:hypothetical protein